MLDDAVLTLVRVLCERFRVKKLELFGSAARGDADPASSDVDFLVEFMPLVPEAHADAYFGLLEALQDLTGRPVDLVESKAVRSATFLRLIERDRRDLYAA